jgi:hypothetical protein
MVGIYVDCEYCTIVKSNNRDSAIPKAREELGFRDIDRLLGCIPQCSRQSPRNAADR